MIKTMKTRITTENDKVILHENIADDVEEFIMFFDKFNILYSLKNEGDEIKIRIGTCEFLFKNDKFIKCYIIN